MITVSDSGFGLINVAETDTEGTVTQVMYLQPDDVASLIWKLTPHIPTLEDIDLEEVQARC